MRRLFWFLVFGVIGSVLDAMPRAVMLHKAFNYVCASNIQGDYLEFGVYKGRTFAQAYHLANLKKYRGWVFMRGMRFYAFDSFQGLPESGEIRLKSNMFNEGQFKCSVEGFKGYLRGKGVDLKKVSIIEGWFSKTLCGRTRVSLPIKSAAVVWVDCDWSESATLVLDFVKRYLVDGTVLVFDDWYLFGGDDKQGEQRAVSRWLKKNPNIKLVEYQKFGWHGNSFIVRKNDE